MARLASDLEVPAHRLEEMFERVARYARPEDQAAALRAALGAYVENPEAVVSVVLPPGVSRHPCARRLEDKNAVWPEGYCKVVFD